MAARRRFEVRYHELHLVYARLQFDYARNADFHARLETDYARNEFFHARSPLLHGVVGISRHWKCFDEGLCVSPLVLGCASRLPRFVS